MKSASQIVLICAPPNEIRIRHDRAGQFPNAQVGSIELLLIDNSDRLEPW